MSRLARILTLILMSLTSALPWTELYAQDISKQKNAINRLETEIKNIDKQLESNRKQQKTNTAELSLLRKKTESQKKLITEIESQIKGYETLIKNKEAEIVILENRIDTMKTRFSRLIRESYKIRDSKVWFLYIIASNSINEGYRRWKYLQNLSVSLKDKTEEIKAKQNEVETEKQEADRLRKSAEESRKKLIAEYETLKKAEKESENTVRKLTAKEKELRNQIAQKRRETEKLNKEIERILAEAVKEANSPKQETSKINYKLSGEFESNKGKLPWPVENGVVIDKFGQHYHPVFKNIKLPYNNGINISAPQGAQARCVFDGIVKNILIIPGYNQCVLIQHGEYYTFYCKLRQVSIKPGQQIKAGQVIGITDEEDGNSVLHFEIWKGTAKQNPELWLR